MKKRLLALVLIVCLFATAQVFAFGAKVESSFGGNTSLVDFGVTFGDSGNSCFTFGLSVGRAAGESYSDSDTDNDYIDGSYDDSYNDGYYDDGYNDGYYDDSYDDSYYSSRETSYDDGTYDDGYYDDGTYDDGYYDDSYNDGNYDDSYNDGYYDDNNYGNESSRNSDSNLALMLDYTYSLPVIKSSSLNLSATCGLKTRLFVLNPALDVVPHIGVASKFGNILVNMGLEYTIRLGSISCQEVSFNIGAKYSFGKTQTKIEELKFTDKTKYIIIDLY